MMSLTTPPMGSPAFLLTGLVAVHIPDALRTSCSSFSSTGF
jgi:hypothetical protein